MLFSRILPQLGGFWALRPVVSKPLLNHIGLNPGVSGVCLVEGTSCSEKNCYVAGVWLTKRLMIWPKIDGLKRFSVCKFCTATLVPDTVLLLTRSALYGFLFWHLYMLIKKNTEVSRHYFAKEMQTKSVVLRQLSAKLFEISWPSLNLTTQKTNGRSDSTLLSYKTIILVIWWAFVIKNSPVQRSTGIKSLLPCWKSDSQMKLTKQRGKLFRCWSYLPWSFSVGIVCSEKKHKNIKQWDPEVTSYCTIVLFFIVYFLERSYHRILDRNIMTLDTRTIL